MGDLILGPGRGRFDASPFGKHRIVEFLPVGWIWEDLWKTRHLPGEATFPSCDVDQVLPKGPFATDLPQKVIPGFDREPQVGEHNMEPRPTITKQMEEELALHPATVSKKACSMQQAGELQPSNSGWGLETDDW